VDDQNATFHVPIVPPAMARWPDTPLRPSRSGHRWADRGPSGADARCEMTDAGSPSGSQPGSGWTPPTGWSGSGDSTAQGTGWGANPTPAAGAGPGSASGPGAMPPGVHPGGHAAGPAWGSAAPAGPAGPSGPQWSGQPASGWGGQAGGWHTSPQWSGGGWGAPQAPKPGVVPLRPLNLGELIDGAFTTIQRYPKIMLGMSAIVMTAVTLLSFLAFSVAGLTSFA